MTLARRPSRALCRWAEKTGFRSPRSARQRQDLKVGLDLARLARVLPATLHLRRNVRLDSGQVQLAVGSTAGPQGLVWHGQLDVANLSGTACGTGVGPAATGSVGFQPAETHGPATPDLNAAAPGGQLVWREPLKIVLDAHDAPGGPVVDRFRCDSDFLSIEAAGTADDLAAQVPSLNLRRLGDDLRQFIDLDGVQLTGEGSGNLRWKHASEGRFEAGVQLRLAGFQWSMRQLPPWHDSDVQIKLAASGQTDRGAAARLDAASLDVKLGSDQLDVKLAEPVTEFSVMRPWSLHARMQGLLQNWAARLAAWLPGGNWRIGGSYVVDADAKVSAGGAAHCDASAEVTRLVFLDSVGRQYVEPVVRLALGGDYDGTTGEVQLGKLQLASSGLALGAARGTSRDRRSRRLTKPRSPIAPIIKPRSPIAPITTTCNWAASSITTSAA